MKNLYFLNRRKSLLSIVSLTWTIVVFASSLFFDFDVLFGKPWSRYIIFSGYISFMIYFGMQSIHRNLVSYNKSGMTIRINSFMKNGTTFVFSEVKNINYITHTKKIILNMENQNIYNINLSNIVPTDIEKLLDIIMKKCKVIKSYPQTTNFD